VENREAQPREKGVGENRKVFTVSEGRLLSREIAVVGKPRVSERAKRERWCEKKDIVNAWSLEKMLKMLK